MSIFFLFNVKILVLALFHYRGANFVHPQWGLMVFSLVKLQKLLDFEIYLWQMQCDRKMYCICGAEEVICLLILCGLFFCPVAIIFFLIFIL